MKRPLVIIVLLYTCGLLLGSWWQPPLDLLFGLSLGLGATALCVSSLRKLLIWPLVIFVGWTNLIFRTAIISPHDLRILLAQSPRLAAVRGTLRETPKQRVYVREGEKSSRSLAYLRVEAIRKDTGWQPAYGQIVVTTPGDLPAEFFAGQKVEIYGVVAAPPTPLAPGLFDYRTYLRHQGIYFQLKASSAQDWQLLSSNTVPPLSDRFIAWAQSTLSRGLPVKDQPLKLLWAMTLGQRDATTDEVYEPFMQSGTMHIFAISGLHIALVTGILLAILRVTRIPRLGCGLILIPLIWLYTAATGWQSSAIRATIMMTIVVGGWALKRPGDLLNSLAAAAFIILLWEPRQLFQASFQLSFFVVLSIALFLPPLEKIRQRWLQTDPFLPAELLPRWKRWLIAPWRIVGGWLAISLAAWLGSWPLIAFYFHLFSPVTLLANLLVVPIASAALACSLGSLICGAWFPWVAVLFNNSAWFWMSAAIDISHTVIKLPGAFFYVASPVLTDLLLYYCFLVAALSGFAILWKRRFWTATVLAFIVLLHFARWENARRTISLTVLPLNGGSSVFVHSSKLTRAMLVDCGNSNSVESATTPYLHAQGVNKLPRLALTHGDIRNIGGAEALQSAIPVDQIVTSSLRFRSPTYRSIIEHLRQTPDRWLVVNRGDQSGAWKVLHPGAEDHFPQADDG
ncbi:MAG TPA: ComEC/Rec2 family competence protein, partial [Verrucomicrobiae bacterium]|nr:ComEC/Rec2 family competence protein [Verrucomicrobiae bacterium]